MNAPAVAPEVGKWVRLRNGWIVGPVKWHEPSAGFYLDDSPLSWTPAGCEDPDWTNQCDIIAVLDGPPVTPLRDWIEWHGGECPLPPETVVQVWLDGETEAEALESVTPQGPAKCWDWSHWASPEDGGNIIKYRVVTP